MSTDNNKENKDEIVKANILALQKNSSGLVRRALQDIDVFAANPNLLVKPITKINPIDGAEMVWIPGDTFTMGSPYGVGFGPEHPAHQVTLSGYWIYKYQVTVAQYCAFCMATSHALPPFPEPGILDKDEEDDNYSWEGKFGWNDPALRQHPIVKVSWDNCKAYADWAKVNIPTEAQWEYAARGPQGRNYPWGGMATKDDLYNGWDESKCANRSNSYNQDISTWPVGSFPAGASWCGSQDMTGNVWEWCADRYGEDYYKTAPAKNPTGPTTIKGHVLRGGSWNYDYNRCRGAFRGSYFPFYAIIYGLDVGFRCASPGP